MSSATDERTRGAAIEFAGAVAGESVDAASDERTREAGDELTSSATDGRMPVVELFVSVNGEGPRAGRLAAFVRFAGCNLRCSYCDTMWANEPGCPVQWLTVDEIAAWVASTPAACTTLTGGEPALQPLLPQLARALMALPPVEDGAGGRAPRAVEIETNGAVDLAELAAVRAELQTAPDSRGGQPDLRGGSREDSPATPPAALHFTMDWKLPGSGMGDRMLERNLGLLGPGDTVKFVAGSEEDLREMARVVRAHGLCERCAVYASPVFGRIEPARIATFLQEERLARVVLQLQLHKIIWPNVERGV